MKERELLPKDQAIIPWEEHDHGDDCWCAPELYQPCPECVREFADVEVDGAKSRAEAIAALVPHAELHCWRCEGRGYVELYDEDVQRLIVHRVMLAEAS